MAGNRWKVVEEAIVTDKQEISLSTEPDLLEGLKEAAADAIRLPTRMPPGLEKHTF